MGHMSYATIVNDRHETKVRQTALQQTATPRAATHDHKCRETATKTATNAEKWRQKRRQMAQIMATNGANGDERRKIFDTFASLILTTVIS
jgi:hypothetical protein